MFIVLLKFSDNKATAPDHMAGHNAWLKQGFDDGVFMLAGSIEPGQGGAILAGNVSREGLGALVKSDPFVIEDVVTAEIVEVSPKKAIEGLQFLVNQNSTK